MSKWISVEDALPEKDAKIIAVLENGDVLIMPSLFDSDNLNHTIFNSIGPDMGFGRKAVIGETVKVAHWMPLPCPPERSLTHSGYL